MYRTRAAARTGLVTLAALTCVMLSGGSVASAAPSPAASSAVDPNDYWCFDEEAYLCLFDGDGGPWAGSLTLSPGNEPEIDLRDPNPDADFSDRITSYTNNVGSTYRFYDQPAGTECWDLIFTAEPHTHGLFPAAADNQADLVVRDGEKTNPCT
jgi:hypothetical protein